VLLVLSPLLGLVGFCLLFLPPCCSWLRLQAWMQLMCLPPVPRAIACLCRVLLLVDASIPPMPLDVACAAWFAEAEVGAFTETAANANSSSTTSTG
jgi:hypothetical protein